MISISKEQLDIILTYCRYERDRTILVLLLNSGMRVGEATNVKAQDFNWDEATVIVLGKGSRYRKTLAGNGIVRE
jgi:site-specific recombinase XerD